MSLQLSLLEVHENTTLLEVWRVYRLIRPMKPATIKDYEKRLPYMPALCAMPVRRITKAHVLLEYQRLQDTGKLTTANYCMRIVRALLEFAKEALEVEGEPLVSTNAAKVLSITRCWTRQNRRTDYIKPSEMKDWLKAALRYPNRNIGEFALFLLLTGCRLNEATKLRWEDVDLDEALVTFRQTKNNTDFTAPVSDFLHAVLLRRQATATSNYVFPGDSPSGSISPWCKANKQLGRESGVPFTFHSLRRTFATTGDTIGLPLQTIAALLNHRSGRTVTSGYIQRSPEVLRPATQAITDAILRQAEAMDVIKATLPEVKYPVLEVIE